MLTRRGACCKLLTTMRRLGGPLPPVPVQGPRARPKYYCKRGPGGALSGQMVRGVAAGQSGERHRSSVPASPRHLSKEPVCRLAQKMTGPHLPLRGAPPRCRFTEVHGGQFTSWGRRGFEIRSKLRSLGDDARELSRSPKNWRGCGRRGQVIRDGILNNRGRPETTGDGRGDGSVQQLADR